MASSAVNIVITYYISLQLLLLLLVAADPRDGVSFSSSYSGDGGQDLVVAMEEMSRANYFTFVMLLNMMMVDQDPSAANNLTFLMPNDRILSRITFSTQQDDQQSSSWSVREFLLRHSIPSPLLFDHLWHFPSGSTIPSSRPGYVLHVHNNNGQQGYNDKWWRIRHGGRGNFSLNDVKIISPNICTSPASSIRCHGIDGVFPLRPISSPPPPYDHCGPKLTPPSHLHHHHHEDGAIAPNPAPSNTHVQPKEASPSSSHTSSSSSWSASSASRLLVVLPLFVFLWRWD